MSISGALLLCGHQRIHGSMDTVAARIDWILKTKGLSARGLSLAASLSQSHVGQIRRGQIGVNASAEVLAKIADAAGVDVEWLISGRGSPERREPKGRPPEDRLQALENAVAEGLARTPGRWSGYVVEMMRRAVRDTDLDCDAAEWERRLDQAEAGLGPVRTSRAKGE